MDGDVSALTSCEQKEIVRDYLEAQRQWTAMSENGPLALFCAAGWVGLTASVWSHQAMNSIIAMAAVAGFLSRNALDYFKARHAFNQIHERWRRKGIDLSSAHHQITSASPPSMG